MLSPIEIYIYIDLITTNISHVLFSHIQYSYTPQSVTLKYWFHQPTGTLNNNDVNALTNTGNHQLDANTSLLLKSSARGHFPMLQLNEPTPINNHNRALTSFEEQVNDDQI